MGQAGYGLETECRSGIENRYGEGERRLLVGGVWQLVYNEGRGRAKWCNEWGIWEDGRDGGLVYVMKE